MSESTRDGLLPTPSVCERYQVVSRTIERWLDDEALGFPRPLIINRRRYFRVAELEQWERAQAAHPHSKPPAPRHRATAPAQTTSTP